MTDTAQPSARGGTGGGLDWKHFKVERVLSDNTEAKSAALLGRFDGKEGQAIVCLTRKPFASDQLEETVTSLSFEASKGDFHNDIYYKLTGCTAQEHSGVGVDVVYPATEKHISKYTQQSYVMYRETPQCYGDVTLPYIRSLPVSSIQWVYNILDKKKEADRIIYEESGDEAGFILLPDMKWDMTDSSQLYCVAICHRKDIRSVRDLTSEHLPLLKAIHTHGSAALSSKFGVERCQLRTYVHYQPSYYHFHVHFTHVDAHVGASALVGKALLLDDIIDNIEHGGSDFYAKKTLSYSLGSAHQLAKRWEEHNAAESPSDKKMRLE